MGAEEAFNRAVRTWTRWLDRNVDSHKTMVFFRSISPEHKKFVNSIEFQLIISLIT